MSRRWLRVLFVVALLAGSGAALVAATQVEAQTPAQLACPASAVLTIAPPQPGAPTTVSVSMEPALNIRPATAADPASLHLHYFVDVPPAAAGAVIPSGDPRIIHSGSTTQDLGALEVGVHQVTVVVGQLDHTACAARATTSIIVGQPTGAPVLPKSGNAELVNATGSAWVVVILLAACLLLVLLTRRGSGRRR